MDIYGNYQKARNASWQMLIDFNISSLPVNIKAIADNSKINIIKNSDVGELSENEVAVSFTIKDKWYIVYDDTVRRGRIRFSVAHELGHIFIGHPMYNDKHHYARKNFDIENKPLIETEADIFASRLLAPACVLWGLNLHTPEEIMKACDISISAAKIRAERMEVLYKRNKFLTSPLEQKVYNNFKDFIDSKN